MPRSMSSTGRESASRSLSRESVKCLILSSRAMLEECLESLLSFYGKGLARILELVEEAGPEGEEVYRTLIDDGAVRGLLLIHGLHPIPLETRLLEALDKIRPYMESHGGDVELLSLDGDVARLRLQGHCKTCPSSAVTMELAIRGAIEEACPDLMGFEVEGVEPMAATYPHAARSECRSGLDGDR